MVVKNPRGTAYFRLLGLDVPYRRKDRYRAVRLGAEPHAWFIGYTSMADAIPAKPDIAIAVILENQGEGSDWAAPVFRGIVQAYYYGTTTDHPVVRPFDDLYTPTPLGGVPTKTPRPRKPAAHADTVNC